MQEVAKHERRAKVTLIVAQKFLEFPRNFPSASITQQMQANHEPNHCFITLTLFLLLKHYLLTNVLKGSLKF